MTPDSRVTVRSVLARADKRWSHDNGDDVIDPPRMDALVHGVQHWLVDGMDAELANTRALLGRLLLAVTGSWDADGDPARQTTDALRQLRLVRAYLLSLQDEQGAA